MIMLAAAPDLENISIANAAIVAVLGYAVVFFGLILLMMVVIGMGKIFIAKDKKAAVKADAAKAAIPTPVVPVVDAAPAAQDLAPGTAGQLKLYDTPPKTAAMIMAIVADKMGKPLNELRFISIKEVK
ncbi:MAG: OadG family transporter subunit [Oscillospiraceae bacterium]|nr:OadG family transporter subunit [Oscillospiraceae bacterium]